MRQEIKYYTVIRAALGAQLIQNYGGANKRATFMERLRRDYRFRHVTGAIEWVRELLK